MTNPARSASQPFVIVVHFDGGETWEAPVWASDPEVALARFLRRKMVARALMSERRARFTVLNGDPDD